MKRLRFCEVLSFNPDQRVNGRKKDLILGPRKDPVFHDAGIPAPDTCWVVKLGARRTAFPQVTATRLNTYILGLKYTYIRYNILFTF